MICTLQKCGRNGPRMHHCVNVQLLTLNASREFKNEIFVKICDLNYTKLTLEIMIKLTLEMVQPAWDPSNCTRVEY